MFVGQTVKEIRPMTEAEMEAESWEGRHGTNMVVVLSNGAKFYASRDDEGNGPGTLFGVTDDGETVYVTPEK